jgi:hypothetical protein
MMDRSIIMLTRQGFVNGVMQPEYLDAAWPASRHIEHNQNADFATSPISTPETLPGIISMVCYRREYQRLSYARDAEMLMIAFASTPIWCIRLAGAMGGPKNDK